MHLEKFGHKFRVPAFADFTAIKKHININEEWNKFLTLQDCITFTSTPEGVDPFLSLVSDPSLSVAQIKETGSEFQRYKLVQELIAAFVGDQSSSKDAEQQQGDKPNPLAEMSKTGS